MLRKFVCSRGKTSPTINVSDNIKIKATGQVIHVPSITSIKDTKQLYIDTSIFTKEAQSLVEKLKKIFQKD